MTRENESEHPEPDLYGRPNLAHWVGYAPFLVAAVPALRGVALVFIGLGWIVFAATRGREGVPSAALATVISLLAIVVLAAPRSIETG